MIHLLKHILQLSLTVVASVYAKKNYNYTKSVLINLSKEYFIWQEIAHRAP